MDNIVATRGLFVFTSAMCLAQLPIQLKHSGQRIGEIVAAFTFVQCIFLIIGPWLLNQLAQHIGGMRNVALVTLAAFIVCQVLYWIAATLLSLLLFLLAQVIHGLVTALFFPFSNTLMELSFNKEGSRKKRGLLQTISATVETAGSFIGIVLITSQLGLLAWGVGVVGAVLTFLLFVFYQFPSLPAPDKTKTWKDKFIHVDVLKVIYPLSFVGIARGMVLVAGSLYLIDNGAHPAIILAGLILGFFGKTLFGILSEKKGDRLGNSICLLLLALGFLGLIATPHLEHYTTIGYWISSMLIGVGSGGVFVGYVNIALETANKNKQTEALSNHLLTFRLGIIAGQWLAGSMLSYIQAWYACIGFCLLSLMIILLQRKREPEPT